MSPLVIRADAGGNLGTGHVMRMLALAQAWRRRGGTAIFATATCPDPLIERITGEGFQHHPIECNTPGDQSDAAATAAISTGWIVLDGYHFREDFQKSCRESGLKILCVDDFGHCEEWFCDLLLNQNLGAPVLPGYPENSLLGESYALIRQEFLAFPRNSKPFQPLRKILVTLGGSDPPNATEWVLRQLAKLNRSDLTVRVIIGPANPRQDELRSLDLPYPVEWKKAVTDMPSEYAWADGVISAGGSSCWEWLYFGLPGAIVTIADNQEYGVSQLETRRLALCLGWPQAMQDDRQSALLASWLDQPGLHLHQEAIANLIDGRGADRVVNSLL